MRGPHPSDDALFAAAKGDDPEDVRAHVGGCPACRRRFERLRAGVSLLDEVRRESTPPVDWRAIDPAVLAAAERTAADIRRGALRAPRRATPWLYGSLAFAAAAAMVVMFRAPHHGSALEGANGVETPAVVAQQEPAPAVADEGAPLDGVVLMVVAPVSYHAPSGETEALTGATAVREGGRLSSDEHGGRAVVALHAGYRVDARAGADVSFARLSTTEARLALHKGEARVDGPAVRDPRVALEAEGWTLRAKGGAFVAKVESDVVRLRVVSGKVGVSRAGGEEREANAGDEVELAKDGSGFRVVSREARDDGALDSALLAQEGRAFMLPRLPERAVITVVGHGTLPPGVSVVRTHLPLTLQAQIGNENWSLLLDPASTAADPEAWQRESRARPALGNVAARVLGSEAASPEPEPATDVRPAETVPSVTVEWGSRELTAMLGPRHNAATEFASRVNECFAACTRAHTCDGDTTVDVTLDPNADGSVSQARVSGARDAALSACVARVGRAFSVPNGLRSDEQHLEIHGPADAAR